MLELSTAGLYGIGQRSFSKAVFAEEKQRKCRRTKPEIQREAQRGDQHKEPRNAEKDAQSIADLRGNGDRGVKAMIRINDRYGIEVSSNDYSLVKFGEVKKGKNQGGERRNYIGYYNTLDGAMYAAMCAIQHDKLAEKDYTLPEALDEVRKIHADCKEMFFRIMGDDLK